MFIQTQSTPNPSALKFLLNQEVSPNNPIHFSKKEDCIHSTLARKLFSIQSVKSVFFGDDFITITKDNDDSWEEIKPEILTMIMDHFMAAIPIFDSPQQQQHIHAVNLSEIELQINEVINTKVRPAVAADGGDIEYHSFEDGIVKLRMKGACAGCPSSTLTLKRGIESLLKYYIPEVLSVEEV